MVNVIGLGYIGLPTALMFATNGVDVLALRMMRLRSRWTSSISHQKYLQFRRYL